MVNLTSYLFPIIDYNCQKEARDIITAQEWNTVIGLLKSSINYTNDALQDIVADLYTKSELSNILAGTDGARLIGIDAIPGITGTNVNAVIRDLKTQLNGVTLGAVPDGSINSNKLASNLNFSGDTLKFNNVDLLTHNNIETTLTNTSVDTNAAGAKAVYDALQIYQPLISMGASEPTAETVGNIYLQYVEQGG